ncbi:MAG: DUF4357 domain-containing protein [Eubacteriales bacterium]|nr:DUF4357 domain-containing protein [Eubacteriales bacterium]
MKLNTIELAGLKLSIPYDFQRLESMPDDPPGSVVYGMQKEDTACYVLLYPIDGRKGMPFDTKLIADGIRACLREEQALIDIQTFETDDSRKVIYTIVKTILKPAGGVQYNLTLQISFREQTLHVQGFFDGKGVGDQEDSLSVLHSVVNTILGSGSEPEEDTGSEPEEDTKEEAVDSLEDGLRQTGLDTNVNALEEMINELLPGLTMFIRDVNLNEQCLAAYQPGTILMERGFTDASSRIMGMKTNHRITILSNHMADCRDLEGNTGWGLFIANHGAHYKVLDVYKYRGKTQILLLHLPDDERWKLFKTIVLSLEENLIADSRKRFENKCMLEVVPELSTENWLSRCSHPIGMDDHGNLYDIEEPVQYLNDSILSMDYQITVRVIMQQLTEDTQKNIQWLRTAMERYKDHPRGKEIIKECARKLYEILPEDEKKELDQAVNKDQIALEKRLEEIRQLIVQKKPEEAKPLLDALAIEADHNPMFREDSASQFFRFREWFEECLYRYMYEPKKDLRRAQYPYDEIYFLQGSMYIDLKDLKKARECLQKALSWNPMNAQISFEYAETFKLSGDMETFFSESRKIQKFALHNRDVAHFLRNTGYYFTEMGKDREAMMCFMRSLLYERDSKTAQSEIEYLHQRFGTAISMPDTNACQDFAKQYGFSLGADNDLLGMMFAYGKHFMEEKQNDAAAYCYGLLYELTEDPEIKKILDQLGVKVGGEKPALGKKSGSGEIGTLYLRNNKADARGMLTEKGFVVLAGSRIYSTPTKSCPDAIKALRKKYKRHIDANLILQKDLTFTSASQAASFVLFASSNGMTNWTNENGVTLKELKG